MLYQCSHIFFLHWSINWYMYKDKWYNFLNPKWKSVSKIEFIMVHGLKENYIAPHTDIELQQRKSQIKIFALHLAFLRFVSVILSAWNRWLLYQHGQARSRSGEVLSHDWIIITSFTFVTKLALVQALYVIRYGRSSKLSICNHRFLHTFAR